MYKISNQQLTRTRCLGGNTLEDIVDEGVKDGHGLVRDTRVRVNLLEHYTDPAPNNEKQTMKTRELIVVIESPSLHTHAMTHVGWQW